MSCPYHTASKHTHTVQGIILEAHDLSGVYRHVRISILSKQVMADIDTKIPNFHTRMMRQEFKSRFEGIVNIKLVLMNEMYRYLTGDSTVVINDISKEIKARLDLLLQSGDPENLVDMRELNKGQPVKYDTFFDHVQAFINRNALEAVSERRHDQTTHMAMAISVHDLIGQVSKDLPEGTAIPSEKYLRLQF